MEGRRDDVICRAAIQYTDGFTESLFSYVNNINTPEGGSHETGFKAAFTKCLNDYARKIGLLKDRDANLAGEDFREGLTCVLTTMVKNPQFEGQTKGRLGNSEVRPVVEAIITQQMTDWLDNLKNQETATAIVSKAVRAAQAREAARKARDNAGKPMPWRPRRWWASWPPAPGGNGRTMSCSSSRETPPAAAPSRAGTGVSRPSFPSAESR